MTQRVHGELAAQAGGLVLLQVLSITERTEELPEFHKALQGAQNEGGLRVLDDTKRSDLEEWAAHDGPAAVMAPHGPKGEGLARQYALMLQQRACERHGLDMAVMADEHLAMAAGGRGRSGRGRRACTSPLSAPWPLP